MKFQVQLAETYRGEPLPRPMWAEPKIDGLRGIVIARGETAQFVSRNGKTFYNAEHILDELRRLNVYAVFDGELFAGTWEATSSICRSQKPHPAAQTLIYIIFDFVPLAEWEARRSSTPLTQRRRTLLQLIEAHEDLLRIIVCPNQEVRTPQEVWEAAARFREFGFEGAVLKDPEAPYRWRRSPAWRKVKFQQTYDVTITGVQPGEGKHRGSLGALLFTHQGIGSEVGTGFTDDERDRLWRMYERGELIGMTVEVSCQEITTEGRFRFPVYVRLREDK